jgi:hypothetical protein
MMALDSYNLYELSILLCLANFPCDRPLVPYMTMRVYLIVYSRCILRAFKIEFLKYLLLKKILRNFMGQMTAVIQKCIKKKEEYTMK